MRTGRGEHLSGSRKLQSAVGPSPAPLGSVFPEATSKGPFRPIVRAWRSKTLGLPRPSRLLPLPGTQWSYATEPRPSGLCPSGTGLGSREVYAALLSLLNHFPNFLGG